MSKHKHRRLSGVREVLDVNPFGTYGSLAAIIIGLTGLAIGADISAGMTNSLKNSAHAVAHLWGLFFALGGVLKLWGLLRRQVIMEIPGLWMMVGGFGFYSITVLIGLGVKGIAAGVMAAAFSLGCLTKVTGILSRARKLANLQERSSNGRSD